jgi:hypothetical protein
VTCLISDRVSCQCARCGITLVTHVHVLSDGKLLCRQCCPVCKPLPHLEGSTATVAGEQAGLFGEA